LYFSERKFFKNEKNANFALFSQKKQNSIIVIIFWFRSKEKEKFYRPLKTHTKKSIFFVNRNI
jgi:hypothetical protein